MTIKSKLILAGIVLTAAVSYLAIAGTKSGGWVYYLEVDQFVADSKFQTQRVRMHGKVGTEDFATNAATLSANFKLLGKTPAAAVAISYRGAIPDMFERGRDVVVEGKFDPSTNAFKADVLMTKCASKYESEDSAAKHPDSIAKEPKP